MLAGAHNCASTLSKTRFARLESGLDLISKLILLGKQLQIGVATDMLASNEHVRNGSLAGDLSKSGLELGAVVQLVQLENHGLGILVLGKQLLGLLAVGAVGLGGDKDLVLGNVLLDGLDSGLGGHGCREETSKEKHFGSR